ncbi:MAG: methyltransferase domain-containing protein [Nostoc sp.]|uniref:methyltransferase domain-containing protein n=1 Tax=Nostoc sp. TaxID=1180 RepID=UPI002FFA079C
MRYRAEELGVNNKITFCYEIPPDETFDTIISFDVLEHLVDPCKQMLQFHQVLIPI